MDPLQVAVSKRTAVSAVSSLENVRLDGKCARDVRTSPACVIACAIVGLGPHKRDGKVRLHEALDKRRKLRRHVVGDDADRLVRSTLDKAGHVLLEHAIHATVLFLKGGCHFLAAQQSALLGRVPVERHV